MRIEHILRVASDLIDEVARLKSVEEECKILKERVFLNQFTFAEQQVFELALDRYSEREMQLILSKEETTIKLSKNIIVRVFI
ncbi:hypothetical protein ACLHDF_23580 [Priestia aryabhattai]|uniref:hypothetical protein n=1 Tax=Priestia megaterium TaxID=1404 RepID=UPI0039B83DB0